MAEPIEIGTVLEGEDAQEFLEYMKNPTYTLEGIKLIREAREIAKKMVL